MVLTVYMIKFNFHLEVANCQMLRQQNCNVSFLSQHDYGSSGYGESRTDYQVNSWCFLSYHSVLYLCYVIFIILQFLRCSFFSFSFLMLCTVHNLFSFDFLFWCSLWCSFWLYIWYKVYLKSFCVTFVILILRFLFYFDLAFVHCFILSIFNLFQFDCFSKSVTRLIKFYKSWKIYRAIKCFVIYQSSILWSWKYGFMKWCITDAFDCSVQIAPKMHKVEDIHKVVEEPPHKPSELLLLKAKEVRYLA